MAKVTVRQAVEKEKEVPTEILAAEIVAMSQGIKRLRAGRLNDKALVLLIQHAAPNAGGRFNNQPLSTKSIRATLDGIANLEAEYLRKPIK